MTHASERGAAHEKKAQLPHCSVLAKCCCGMLSNFISNAQPKTKPDARCNSCTLNYTITLTSNINSGSLGVYTLYMGIVYS
jgi:hypothetical protein